MLILALGVSLSKIAVGTCHFFDHIGWFFPKLGLVVSAFGLDKRPGLGNGLGMPDDQISPVS